MVNPEAVRWLVDVERLLKRCLRLVLVIGILLLAATSVPAAQPPYERTTKRLSETLAASRALAKERDPYDVAFRRDPMHPIIDAQGHLMSSAGLRGGLSIQGVLWSEDHPLAVVDDELFTEGETVGPYTILEIRTDGVIVQRGGDDQRLFIPLDRGIEPLEASSL